VRFDGNHKLDSFLTRHARTFFEWVPSAPRSPSVWAYPAADPTGGQRAAPRAVGVKDASIDVYGQARRLRQTAGAQARRPERLCVQEPLAELWHGARQGVSACGIPAKSGREFTPTRFSPPALAPAEEEGRLSDPRLRENFIERVFVYALAGIAARG